ncbi:bifunctional 2-methylcitrate synthase/citrate synthase [Mycolicibacterium fortuitum]|jgi:citrate synthase|uniref:bifunctional 2-methylcitrate synthase/citrate synthase n=1 Tax=Mycolicibacterium fortuitum TaxID=1766 RepID=UPI0007EBE176|nr:bifunctional 2-methylcitrate synthase/citrate synthase [Mycolicibacterium fortuitum]MBP3085086.1 bifunctional 2-methylcitrate synthase/citrate synthase [Mycolicibacterium fortuitum]MCA4752625.1 bifunctional 2-methylcitrate synthase/citrate synthase [Mycolicibacterium fortuitum]NOP94825.1 bifunctional 2-methylcitrate synthase/citrate synthase [Mycolicibacterium fortuitum]NOQ61845.1 bifunctional 2-methylcitrate synthase/citrate synthase [Mycolicibacterium fortuitum]NOQ99694.1 bifunctional 2-m
MTATANDTVTPSVHKGLAGVVVDTTAISKVVPETNSLTYRGYAVQDLAAHCSFEQVAYLLWHGELPTDQELALFSQRERASRRIDRSMQSLLAKIPDNCHPMDVVRTAISYLGAEDPEEDDSTPSANFAKSLRMFAVLPTIVAADMRRRRGLEPIAPHSHMGYAENFLNMCFGEVPDPVIVRAFEQSMILYAEHSFNASTFAARVVTSTQSDIYSAVTAAIGALKGSLHGGANEAVMHDMLEIGSAENAAQWLHGKLSRKDKVMGFGHRVYKNGDSRVPTMKAALQRVAAVRDGQRWLDLYERMEQNMLAATGIKPNLDFPTGPAYYLMGFDIPSFTPLFVMSRITGWTAHIMEQAGSNALIRPLSEYSGHPQRALA